MRYCLRCCDICSDTSEEYELYPESCATCGATGEMLKEDGVTGEQYEQMTEDEKDEYEVKIRLEVENSPYFNEELYFLITYQNFQAICKRDKLALFICSFA